MSITSLGQNIFGMNSSTKKIDETIAARISQIRNSGNDGIQFNDIEEMAEADPKLIAQLEKAARKIGDTEKLTIVAKDLESKTAIATTSMAKMRREISEISAAINGYNSNMTTDDFRMLKTKFDTGLKVIAAALNTTYSDGSFVFGGGKDGRIQPVDPNKIIISGTIAPNGTLSDDFVFSAAKSEDKIAAISSTTNINSTISAANQAFVDVLGGIWLAYKDLKDAEKPPATLASAAKITLDKGIAEFDSLMLDVKDRQTKAQEALEQNTEELTEAQEELSKMKLDGQQGLIQLSQDKRFKALLMNLEALQIRSDTKIMDIIAHAASAG